MKIRLLIVCLLINMHVFADTDVDTDENEAKPLTFDDIKSHAEYWIKQLPKLNDDEINLLSNLFYFQALSNHYESIARQTLIAIHNSSIIMNKQLVQSESEAGKTALHNSKLLKQLKEEFLPKRRYSLLSGQACLKNLEQSDLMTLKEIIVNLQQYTKSIITQFTKQDRENIQVIDSNYQILNTHLEKLESYKVTLKAIVDHENPYLKDGDDIDTGNFDVAVALADAILGSLNEITLGATMVKMMSCDVLNICKLINTVFYNALYESLDEEQQENLFAMFDKNGLIEENKRSQHLILLDDTYTINKKNYA